MLLTGRYERTIDEKSRLAVPKRLRDSVSNSEECVLFLAPGTDGSLDLYTEEAFEKLGQQLAMSSPNQRNVRAFSRMFYGQALRCEVDKQGRIRIPQELIDFAKLKKEVILLGVRDHIEVWDKEVWDQYSRSMEGEFDQLAETAFNGTANEFHQASPQELISQPQPANTPNQPR